MLVLFEYLNNQTQRFNDKLTVKLGRKEGKICKLLQRCEWPLPLPLSDSYMGVMVIWISGRSGC